MENKRSVCVSSEIVNSVEKNGLFVLFSIYSLTKLKLIVHYKEHYGRYLDFYLIFK